MGMFLTFYQLNNKQDSGQCTASSVPLIPKWMGLPRTEDTSWACPSSIPDGHRLVETYLPRGKKYEINVVIQCLYHLANLPKLINIGWGVGVSEHRFTSDGVKAVFRHEFPEAIRVCFCLLIKGFDTPIIFPFPFRNGGH